MAVDDDASTDKLVEQQQADTSTAEQQESETEASTTNQLEVEASTAAVQDPEAETAAVQEPEADTAAAQEPEAAVKDEEIPAEEKGAGEDVVEKPKKEEEEAEVAASSSSAVGDSDAVSIDLNDGTFETLDEYKHIDEDDIVLVDDKHPDANKTKEQIEKEEAAKQKAEKIKEAKRLHDEKRKARREEFLNLTNAKRDADLSTLKPRDVETVRCEWVVLDRALDLCPQLKTIHETPAFQENLATLLKEIAGKSTQQVS